MDVAASMVDLGQRLLRGRFRAPTDHWRSRVWDGNRAEAHGVLGPAYITERESIRAWIVEAAPNRCVLDVGAGTGRYSLDAAIAGARHVVALDVSRGALEEVKIRARERELASVVTTRLGDFWTTEATCVCGGPFGLVLCLDAIHHLGPIPEVLERLAELAGTAGSVVGDVWTRDSFGDFQRARRGHAEHLAASARFLILSSLIALGVRTTSDAVRSDLRLASEVSGLATTQWPDACVEKSSYWVRFAALQSREGTT